MLLIANRSIPSPRRRTPAALPPVPTHAATALEQAGLNMLLPEW